MTAAWAQSELTDATTVLIRNEHCEVHIFLINPDGTPIETPFRDFHC